MRMLVALAIVSAGCNVAVGRGQIAPIGFDVALDPGMAAPPITVETQLELLSEQTAAQISAQYGKKLGAIEEIDVVIDDLRLIDSDGKPWAGTSLTVRLEDLKIDHAGQQVRLPDDVVKRIVEALRHGNTLSIMVQLTADWPADMVPASVHGVLQPIIVVNALQAL